MTVQDINLELPPSLYRRIKEMAEASQKTLTEVLIQSIRTGAPPSLDQVPERFRIDLKPLSRLPDDVLAEVMRQDLDLDKKQRYEELLGENDQGRLEKDDDDLSELSLMREEADLLMFRRAYAAALLKWRGHRVSTLDI